MPLYDFKCTECENKFEDMVPSTVTEVNCTACGSVAKRLLSCPRIALDGTDPAFPSAWDKWEKSRKQKMAQERKAETR